MHLPIMSRFEKINIPLMGDTRKLKMVHHCSIVKTSNAKQVRESCLKGLIPTPIMPESNIRAIPHLKSSMARTLPPNPF